MPTELELQLLEALRRFEAEQQEDVAQLTDALKRLCEVQGEHSNWLAALHAQAERSSALLCEQSNAVDQLASLLEEHLRSHAG